MTPQKPARILWYVFLFATLALALPFIIGEFRLAADGDIFNLNMRSLYFFFRFHDAELFRNDYAADYFLHLWTPPGFLALQYLWAQFADPMILHRFLSPALWLACGPLVFFSGKRLGGRANAWATLGIYLCSSIFLFRMSAGVPHSFGFPLTWWVVAALLSGRVKSLAIATAVSAAIYPFMVPIAGLTLAFWLLFPKLSLPHNAPELRWSRTRKLIFLAATAFIAVLLTGSVLSHRFTTDYGRPIHILHENEAFPESGPDGRNVIFSPQSQPINYLLLMVLYQNSTRLGGMGSAALTLAGMAILLAGVLLHDARDRRPGALKPFLYATAVCFFGSLLVNYRVAYHFAIYPTPVLLTLFLPLALRRISRRIPAAGTVFTFLVLGYMACIAEAQPEASGYINSLDDSQKHALAFVATLPKNAMFAGWPGEENGKIIEDVPYFARRKALVTWESHAALHTGYVLAMRGRMNALVDAYLAHDKAPLIALRDIFHVDYLIVNEADFTAPPKYFVPFTARAEQRWKEAHGNFIALRLPYIYSQDGIDIIDLHKL